MPPALSEVVAMALQVDPAQLTRRSAIGDVPSWDSMQQVVLMSLIERTYGAQFADEEIVAATSVPKIEAALTRCGVAVVWA